MKYRKRDYKYQLVEPHFTNTSIKGFSCDNIYFTLTKDGQIIVKALYAWDGASGPTIDDKDISVQERNELRSRTAVPSLNHDVKYQMLRLGIIPIEYKSIIDQELHDDLEFRGFNSLRCDIWHLGVHFGGSSSCEPGTDNDNIMEAE